MENIEELSKYLKAISDPTRLKIIKLLSDHKHPICVNSISNKLNVTQSAISQHLRILKQLDLVFSDRAGYHIHYKVNRKRLGLVVRHLETFIK